MPTVRPSAPAASASRALHATRTKTAAQTVPSRVALARGRSGLWLVVAALGAFAVLFATVRANRSAAADLAITLRFQRRRHPVLAKTMSLVSWPGFPPQSRIIPWVFPTVLYALGYRLEALFQLMAWGTGGISYTFKRTMRRPRPDHPEIRIAIARIGGSSFPSGHVINYTGVYGFLAFLVHGHVRPPRVRRVVVSFLLGLIALVGPSRVYLGHHWATDVLASYLLGTSYVLGLAALYRRVKTFLVRLR